MFLLKLKIVGISLLCLGQPATPGGLSCPGVGPGEATVLLVDATTETATACSRPYCDGAQKPEGCAAGEIRCLDPGVSPCPLTGQQPACSTTRYLLCGEETLPCEGGRYECVTRADDQCRALDGGALAEHRPLLMVNRAFVDEIDASQVRYQALQVPPATEVIVIDLAKQVKPEKRCIELRTGSGSPLLTYGPGSTSDREPRPEHGIADEWFGWVASLSDLSRDVGRLHRDIEGMGAGLVDGRVIGRLDLRSGMLKAADFEVVDGDFRQHRSCPDRRPILEREPVFPRAVPDVIYLEDQVPEVASVAFCGGRDFLYLRPAAPGEVVELSFGNVAVRGGEPTNNHLKWYYELFELDPAVSRQVLPIAELPDESIEPGVADQGCDPVVGVGNALCPATSYP